MCKSRNDVTQRGGAHLVILYYDRTTSPSTFSSQSNDWALQEILQWLSMFDSVCCAPEAAGSDMHARKVIFVFFKLSPSKQKRSLHVPSVIGYGALPWRLRIMVERHVARCRRQRCYSPSCLTMLRLWSTLAEISAVLQPPSNVAAKL